MNGPTTPRGARAAIARSHRIAVCMRECNVMMHVHTKYVNVDMSSAHMVARASTLSSGTRPRARRVELSPSDEARGVGPVPVLVRILNYS